MKKLKLLSLTVLLGLIIFGCKKNYLSVNENRNEIQNKIISYLNHESKISHSDKAQKIDSIAKELDFSTIQLENIFSTKAITIEFYSKNSDVNTTSIQKMIFFDTGDLITKAIIISVNSEKGKLYSKEHFSEIITHQKSDYSGTLTLNDISNSFIGEYGFKNGNTIHVKNLFAKPKSETNQKTLGSIDNETECTAWYLVTTYFFSDGSEETTSTYLYTTCESTGGGGGGGGGTEAINDDKHVDDGPLSCKSFTFRSMTSTMYEAGLSGLQFVMDIAGGGSLTFNYRPIYIGFPSLTANGKTYSPSQAAAITAAAMNRAGATMAITYFGISTTQAATITTTQLENEFKLLVQAYISQEINAGATASYYQSGSNTITNNAVWNSGWDRFINAFTHSGCD